MILDDIKKANIQALKDKDSSARAIYSVVLTKAMMEAVKKREKSETLSDEDLSHILQKTLKELIEEKENYQKANNPSRAQDIERQKEIISKFLPKMLCEKEIFDIISSQTDRSLPFIMKFFKANYAGKVDLKTVSEVLKNF